MNYGLLSVLAYLAIVFDTSVAHLLAVHGLGGIQPSATGCLIVFVALFAPKQPALWSALIIGLLMDLAVPQAGVVLIGPHALGFLAAAYMVLLVRTMVFRRQPLTVSALTAAGLIAVAIVATAIHVIRGWYPSDPALLAGADPSALGALFKRFGIAIYSGLLALPLGWFLLQTAPWWKFQTVNARR